MGANHVLYAWLLMLSLITSRQLFQMDRWSWLMIRWAKGQVAKSEVGLDVLCYQAGDQNRLQDSDKLAEKKMHLGLTFRFFRSHEF